MVVLEHKHPGKLVCCRADVAELTWLNQFVEKMSLVSWCGNWMGPDQVDSSSTNLKL